MRYLIFVLFISCSFSISIKAQNTDNKKLIGGWFMANNVDLKNNDTLRFTRIRPYSYRVWSFNTTGELRIANG
jgi:hypothetical protein